MSAGRVEGIYLAPESGAPTAPVKEVQAIAGQGLAGDRKFRDRVLASKQDEPGRDLTLIEAEAIEGLAEAGIELGPGEARRQVVTRGIGLNDLVDRRFAVGESECVGIELCEPCSHLEGLTRPGVMRGLVHRGGLRADILVGGTIRVGDEIRTL